MHTVELVVGGRVQGVGFRPFVYRLARKYRLNGHVKNTPQGVEILVQGERKDIGNFQRDVALHPPPLARINSVEERVLPSEPAHGVFEIKTSTKGQRHQAMIGPETATCPECLQEISDPGNPRFFYPFTNCTNCGPRYTITGCLPYDRAGTSMACFSLCPDCQREYHDPLDRRFHAQPNACPRCGPTLWYTGPKGETLTENKEAITLAAQDLQKGLVLGIKGLGGFHLACRGDDRKAVCALRKGKRRPDKPLAVMAFDLESAERIVFLTAQEREWLGSRQRPILVAQKRPSSGLPEEVAPDCAHLGIMLPYTPLHHLLLKVYRSLFSRDRSATLVMTSGNISSEPLVRGNREALEALWEVADRFLLHNRDILIRCDDSVLGIPPAAERPLLFRRARGFTPAPIMIKDHGISVLGLGAQKKTTICLTRGNQAFVSQHLGDLDNLSTYAYYRETIAHFRKLLGIKPNVLVADLHPDFLSSRYAAGQNELPAVSLQHHFAHIYAVLGENRVSGPALGLALDGSGLGLDRTVWGGELLLLHPGRTRHKRLGHFAPVPLPGGEAAVGEPWRMAQSFLYTLKIRPGRREWPWLSVRTKAADIVSAMLEKGINCMTTTSCGRLFDAVSALLGLALEVSYEGQAAVRLEATQDLTEAKVYPCPLLSDQSGIVLDTLTLFLAAYRDWEAGIAARLIGRRFHNGLIQGLANWALQASRQTGIRRIALSGGVFQNMTLAGELPQALERVGLQVLVHRELPPNDGCISYGQAVYGGFAHALSRD